LDRKKRGTGLSFSVSGAGPGETLRVTSWFSLGRPRWNALQSNGAGRRTRTLGLQILDFRLQI